MDEVSSQPSLASGFSAADKNGDGKLDAAEFESLKSGTSTSTGSGSGTGTGTGSSSSSSGSSDTGSSSSESTSSPGTAK